MELDKKMRVIPRSLAFDMLFGSNSGEGHKVIDEIYDGLIYEFESRTCNNCKHWCNIDDRCYEINIDGKHTITSCSEFARKGI